MGWDAKTKTLTVREWPEIPQALLFAITAIEQKPDGSFKFTFADKLAAMNLVARLGGWIVDKSSVRVIRSLEDLTDDELTALEASAGRTADR
jgi:hypothetical protein